MLLVLLVPIGVLLLVAGIATTVSTPRDRHGARVLGRAGIIVGSVFLVLAIAYIVAVASAR